MTTALQPIHSELTAATKTHAERFRGFLAEQSDLLERYRVAAMPLTSADLCERDRLLLAALSDLTRARTALLRVAAAFGTRPGGP